MNDITILGGGIAGLAAATALAQRGRNVRVYEQSPEITEVGAGLQISPNGARVLNALGLADALREGGIGANSVRLIDGQSNRGIVEIPMPPNDYRFFHRADLIEILYRAADAAGVEIILNARAASIDAYPDHVDITFENSDEVTATVVIAADGVHSVARAAVCGPQSPRFTGQVAWRALIPNRSGADPVARVHLGPGRHLVHYPLAEGRLINIAAFEERSDWVADGWNHQDDPKNLRAAFGGFSPQVRALLDLVQDVHLWGLHRYPDIEKWSNGALCLIGDAAHPTLPFLGQGANMALEDAFQLALRLDASSTPELAFRNFEESRRPRTSKIVRAATANAHNYHMRGLKRRVGHAFLRVIGKIAPRILTRPLHWIYDYDATRLPR